MKTTFEDFGITVTKNWIRQYTPPFEGSMDRQVLSTGHLAPKNDPDIRKNNKITGMFPHCPLLGENIKAIVKPGQCALDVGAFIGDNSNEFTNYGLKVIGIEPFLDAYECALINAPDALLIHAAAGDGEIVQLEYRCHGDNHGMRSVRPLEDEKGLRFNSLRIDDLGITKLELIKIDVEGSESRVIAGARKTILKLKPVLIVEVNQHFLGSIECAMAIGRDIQEMGYTVTGDSERTSWDWIGIPK